MQVFDFSFKFEQDGINNSPCFLQQRANRGRKGATDAYASVPDNHRTKNLQGRQQMMYWSKYPSSMGITMYFPTFKLL